MPVNQENLSAPRSFWEKYFCCFSCNISFMRVIREYLPSFCYTTDQVIDAGVEIITAGKGEAITNLINQSLSYLERALNLGLITGEIYQEHLNMLNSPEYRNHPDIETHAEQARIAIETAIEALNQGTGFVLAHGLFGLPRLEGAELVAARQMLNTIAINAEELSDQAVRLITNEVELIEEYIEGKEELVVNNTGRFMIGLTTEEIFEQYYQGNEEEKNEEIEDTFNVTNSENGYFSNRITESISSGLDYVANLVSSAENRLIDGVLNRAIGRENDSFFELYNMYDESNEENMEYINLTIERENFSFLQMALFSLYAPNIEANSI